ncbi:glycosyltransferase family 2 protein [candidate division CSSED10-310 bacterium]|uniref:Glycosyltransferase family 2 protein n=1 Tax=candidate division CSSED10-310 bacterium TaxID=2855610 RepID=A0ABV6YUY9_UNCC1
MNKDSKTIISIVIPFFDEEQVIPSLLARLDDLCLSHEGFDLEIILVDDHSSDNTPHLLKEAVASDERYRYIRLAVNSGSHIAILAGLEHARGECAVFLAADLQDPPELIPKMLENWQNGNHIVWAVRQERIGVSRIDRSLANMFYWLLRTIGMVQMPPQGSDFALLDRKVIDALVSSITANPSLGGEIIRLGFRQTHIPYTKVERVHGKSRWTIERKLRAFADAFVAFSYIPLRFMSYLGIMCSFLGFIYAAVVIILRLSSAQPIQGWASLMVIVLLLGGIQMIMLGVLGEYLWRTLETARRRPRYFIEDSIRIETQQKPRDRSVV